MLRTAFLGAQFVGQLSARKPEQVDVVWLGASPAAFAAEVPALKPDVVVISLSDFSEGTDQQVRQLIDLTRAELTILTYSFARRALIRTLQAQNVRVLQSPITFDVLQAHLAPLIVRQSLQPRREIALMPVAPTRFSSEQLGKLMEVASSVQCECPNHVAQLVERLQSFEKYSKDCESRNEPDRAIHTMLYETTARVRAEMETALAKLVEHENLVV